MTRANVAAFRRVVATQGLGAAVVAQIGGTPQFNQWFLYVLLVFVVVTLLVEIVYLNVGLPSCCSQHAAADGGVPRSRKRSTSSTRPW